MKARIAVPIALIVFGLWFIVYWRMATFNYYPSPAQKSSFLNSYTPKGAVDKLRYRHGNQAGYGEGASAGNRFVMHKTEFREYYVASKKSDASDIAAIESDIQRQLFLNHGHFLSRKKDEHSVISIDYELGQVLGSIKIDPLTKTQPASYDLCHPMPADFEDKLLHITVEEKWFPKGIPSLQELARGNG